MSMWYDKRCRCRLPSRKKGWSRPLRWGEWKWNTVRILALRGCEAFHGHLQLWWSSILLLSLLSTVIVLLQSEWRHISIHEEYTCESTRERSICTSWIGISIIGFAGYRCACAIIVTFSANMYPEHRIHRINLSWTEARSYGNWIVPRSISPSRKEVLVNAGQKRWCFRFCIF